MVTEVSERFPLNPPPVIEISWPPWTEPEPGLTPDTAITLVRVLRLLAAVPTAPSMLTTTL